MEWIEENLQELAETDPDAAAIQLLSANPLVLSGTILIGDNSAMTLTLQKGSSFEGTFSGEITNAKGGTVSTEIGSERGSGRRRHLDAGSGYIHHHF